MTEAKRTRVLEKTAVADLWRNTLAQIPTVFGRLAYLSSLRNSNTGGYEHHGLAMLFGEEEADRALRQSHAGAFSEWLGYSLEQQKADLDLYLSTVDASRKTVVETWTKLHTYQSFMPTAAGTPDRDLFVNDLQTLLSLLINEFGVSLRDPDA